jgi:hypothetical protein
MTQKKICGAKNRQGEPCGNSQMPNGRCKYHGGLTPVGPASPHYKNGRRSKLMKEIKGLGEHYERALSDPDLLRLDDEIALVDARIAQLLEKASTPRSSIDGLWPQLDALIESRRKLVDTESKRMKDLHAMVSVDRVMLIVSYLADSVKKHVKDTAAQTAILTDLRRLLKPEAALPA